MSRLCKTLLLFSIFLNTSIFAQQAVISGILTDGTTQDPLIGATVKAGKTGTATEFDGSYSINLEPGEYNIEFRYVGFETITETVRVSAGEAVTLNKTLSEETNILNTATVTSGKFEKALGEVTVSLEVLKPNLLENTNKSTVAGVLDKVPGVNMVGGQANIRGGSGFSYGAGSRVLLLVDDIPILQADAGFPQWNDVPIENVEQVEVIKGAASALYGSSALNGIINVRTAYAKSEPATKIAPFYTYFMKPKDEYKAWWSETGEQPYATGVAASHKRKMGKLDLVTGGYYRKSKGVREGTGNSRGRVNLNLRYRITDRLSAGVSSNFNRNKSTSFFFWGDADTSIYQTNLELSRSDNTRFNIDPYVTYFDNTGNRHKFNGRFFKVKNNTGTSDSDQSNRSDVFYGEYQFQRKWNNIGLVSTAGVVLQRTFVEAMLYGNSQIDSRNLAGYVQLDKKFGDRLNVSLGARLEQNEINAPDTLNGNIMINNVDIPISIPAGVDKDSEPVIRLGLNYKSGEATYFRASFGQGYRYATIAEKYIMTTFGGGFPVLPNPELEFETGWSGELGVKQGFQISNFKGYIDLVGFWSEYQDMMEFNIQSVSYPPFTGFQSVNVGNTIIKGGEITIAGRGSIGNAETTVLAGYTYLDPKFKEFDIDAEPGSEAWNNAAGSSICSESHDPNRENCQNVLKYRYKNTFKFDVETKFNNKFSIGIGGFYNSKMLNIDDIFESTIVPGLEEFRRDRGGDLIFNSRIAYYHNDYIKISLIGDNLFNSETSSRPGELRAPRHLTVRADFDF